MAGIAQDAQEESIHNFHKTSNSEGVIENKSLKFSSQLLQMKQNIH